MIHYFHPDKFQVRIDTEPDLDTDPKWLQMLDLDTNSTPIVDPNMFLQEIPLSVVSEKLKTVYRTEWICF